MVRVGGLFVVYINSEVLALSEYPSSRQEPTFSYSLIWVSSLLFSGLEICNFLVVDF